jgi:hypothetical protein
MKMGFGSLLLGGAKYGIERLFLWERERFVWDFVE